MAITQYSRIQHRRGKAVDLPPVLETSELGHSTDERRLYIGNGDTIIDNAPVAGNTEILTEFSPVLDLVNHTYISNTSIVAAPGVSRTLQEVLDDSVSIKDYGVVGNGTGDDSTNINKALEDLYTVVANSIQFPANPGSPASSAKVQAFRTLYFPAGVYILDADEMFLPTDAEIVGDGPDKTIIIMVNSSKSVAARTADSFFQTDLALGTPEFGHDPILPNNIRVRNLTLSRVAGDDQNILHLDRASNILFENVKLKGGWNGISATTSCAVYLDPLGTVYQHNNIRFKNCEFADCGAVTNLTAFGLDVVGIYFESCKYTNLYKGIIVDPTDPSALVYDIKVTNGFFKNVQSNCIYAGIQSQSVVSSGNTFFDCGQPGDPVIVFTDGAVNCHSIADTFELAVGVVNILNNSKSCLVLNPQTDFIFRNIVITSKAPSFSLLPGRGNPITFPPELGTLSNIAFDIAKTDSMFLDYTIKRRGFTRIGRIFLATDGTEQGTTLSDLYTESGPTGVQFDYSLATLPIVRIVYSSDSARAIGTELDPILAGPQYVTGDTNGTATITNIDTTTLNVGMLFEVDTGGTVTIPAGTKIASIDVPGVAGQITLDALVTGSSLGEPFVGFDTITINSNEIKLTGIDVQSAINDITPILNPTPPTIRWEILGNVNNLGQVRLELVLYAFANTPEQILISATGTVLADLGLDATYDPPANGEFHAQTKTWLMDDTVTQTSFWLDSFGDQMVTDTGEDLVFGEI